MHSDKCDGRGDQIVSVNGRAVRSTRDVVLGVSLMDSDSAADVEITVKKPSGEVRELRISPIFTE